jgi:geranylgeranyl diphosphate synthase type II
MNGKLGDIEVLTRPSSAPDRISALVTDLVLALAQAPEIPSVRDSSAGELLWQSMHYSLGLRGKRARGLLVLLVADGWDVRWQRAVDCARAAEMVHTASLIIDDLPCMDDAALRRRQPSNHVKFGEPTAVLAGISLLSEALRLLASSETLTPDQRNEAVTCLASAIGPVGMAAGQLRDIYPAANNLANVERTHALKTGSLFAASAELGCIVAGVSGPRKWMLSDFGMLIGKAFQEFDDLIDVFASSSIAGKDIRKDTDKPTVVGLVGREAAATHPLQQVVLSLECLEASGIKTQELEDFVLELTRAMRRTIGDFDADLGAPEQDGFDHDAR